MECLMFVFLIVNCASIAMSQMKISPCPSVFTFDLENDSSDTWYGTIKLESQVVLYGITIDVIFDRQVAAFGAYYFNDVTTRDDTEFRIENKNFKFDQGRTLVINVYTRYNGYIPLVKQIRFNGQNVCKNVAVQPIQGYQPAVTSSNSNSQTNFIKNTSTKKATRRDNPDPNYASYDSERTTQQTTINNGKNDNIDDNFSLFSGHEKPQATNNERTTQKPLNQNSNRETYNQPSSNINNSNGFIVDSLSGSIDNINYSTPTTRRSVHSVTSTTYRPSIRATTKKSTYFQGDLPFLNNGHNIDETTTLHSILNIDADGQCGTIIPKVNPLIVHGEETYQGQFPWHAALYLSDVGSLKYICGGSLVSMKAIVTAAHCVTYEKTTRAISSNNLLAYLGKNNLQKWNGPEQDAKVLEIVVHPDYNPEQFYSDIAILKLKDTLTRTNYVRTICLWNFNHDLKLIVNKLGWVPGWGYNENGLVSEDLSYIQMPVVTHETCIWSNRDFFSKVTSDRSFCAGFRNGSTACNGDSGGSMVFKQGSQWYLRGIVSISVALQNSLRCNANEYAVFVDAAKFTTWIKEHF